MWHTELEHGGSAVPEFDRCHPCAARPFKRRTERERPSALQIPYRGRQPVEPCQALRRFAAVSRKLARDLQCHTSIVSVCSNGILAPPHPGCYPECRCATSFSLRPLPLWPRASAPRRLPPRLPRRPLFSLLSRLSKFAASPISTFLPTARGWLASSPSLRRARYR